MKERPVHDRLAKADAVLGVLLLFLVVGCSKPVPLSSYVPEGGRVELVVPHLGKEGCLWFGVRADPPMANSALYVSDFDAEAEGNRILVTAEMSKLSRFRKTRKAGGAIVCGLQDGEYTVYYRDPSGAMTHIGRVTIDRASELSG